MTYETCLLFMLYVNYGFMLYVNYGFTVCWYIIEDYSRAHVVSPLWILFTTMYLL